MRMVFDQAPVSEREALELQFAKEIGEPLRMDYEFHQSSHVKRVVAMVSREDHCLSDLLWRWRNGDLGGELIGVISNHPDHADQVETVGLPFHHVPIQRERKREAEQEILALLEAADLLVLARYMQILSEDFLRALAAPAINIHHSFLPAFVGADPYHRAYERGVKLIGAIAQDVEPVDHRDEVTDMIRIGRDIERLVLARAVMAHLDDRVLRDGDRTIVF
jgi:formyltetrahydrofolate deformylase